MQLSLTVSHGSHYNEKMIVMAKSLHFHSHRVKYIGRKIVDML
jgi:hypothetical protein